MRLLLAALAALGAWAHTESDVVAVPAGARATVTLAPTHGCGDSPTVAVSTRVPVAGATAGDVPGWTASVEADEEGRTVVEWTGGLLPADRAGAFPVTFTAPDEPGLLLTFPFVQTCEDGSELAWISGDPGDEHPSPRVLVLPAGSEPAATIDDVPTDAPGREQLVAIVDVDGGAATTATSPGPATTGGGAGGATTAVPPTTTDDADAPADDGGGAPVVPVAVLVVVLVTVGLVVFSRRR